MLHASTPDETSRPSSTACWSRSRSSRSSHGRGAWITAAQGPLLLILCPCRAVVRYQNGRGTFLEVTNALAQLAHDAVLLSLEKDPHRKKFYEGSLEIIAIAFIAAIFGFWALVYFLRKEKRNVA